MSGGCTCFDGCRCPDDCATYAICLRNKNVIVGYAASSRGLDATKEKNWNKELDLYKSARAQGIQPASTKTADIRKAIDVSNKTGVAYDASGGN